MTVGGVKCQGDPIVVDVVVNTPEYTEKTPPRIVVTDFSQHCVATTYHPATSTSHVLCHLL